MIDPHLLHRVVRTTVAGFRGRLDAAGIDVALDEGAAVVARADRERLRQVLIDLIENAIAGLGLAIVLRTAEAHGGRVTAVPGAEGGLAVDVTLPLERASA